MERKLGFTAVKHIHLLLQAAMLAVTLTASASTLAQAPSAPTQVVSLCTVSFDSVNHMRISSEGRACLDDVALNLQKFPGTTLAVIGNAASSEKGAASLSARRAMVVKRYLVQEKGVGVKRMTLYSGHQDSIVVSVSMIPKDGAMELNGLNVIDESKLKK